MFSHRFLISVLVLACCAAPAPAALVTYCTVTGCSDPSSGFTGATTSDTFNSIAVTQGNLGTSFVDVGLDFSDPATLTGSLTPPSGWPTGATIVSGTSSTGNTLTITLPSSVDAIDFYVGMQAYDNFTISVTDSTGGTYTDGYFNETTTGGPNPLFFGITTTSTFTSFTITSQTSADKITLDDISFGSAGSDPAPTPEVATLFLVGTGLSLMVYGRRKTQRRQAARRGMVRTIVTGITPA